MHDDHSRIVRLREIETGRDSRFLSAYLDDEGNLHIDGHDLGAATSPVSSDSEYEWFQVIAAADLARFVTLLDGHAGEDVLDLLARDWTGTRSDELEKRLRESDIPIDFSSWSG